MSLLIKHLLIMLNQIARHWGSYGVRRWFKMTRLAQSLVEWHSRLFAKNGYRVALIARTELHLKSLAEQINKDGGEVRTTFAVT